MKNSPAKAPPTYREPFVRFNRRPQFDPTLGSTAPINEEEEQLVASLANELGYAFCRAAANPDRDYACNSIEGRVQRLLLKRSPEKRQAYQRRAQSLLNQDFTARQHYFGEWGEPNARQRISETTMNARRRTLVKAAVQERVLSYRKDLTEFAKFASTGAVPSAFVVKTFLKGKLTSATSGHDTAFTQTTINEPQELQFFWTTEVEDAEIGEWQVYLAASNTIVATGRVDHIGPFKIDFSAFLQDQPPATPLDYVVHIRPRSAAQTVITSGSEAGETSKHTKTSEILGWFSNGVGVSYVAGDSADTSFDFVQDWSFTELELFLDSIHLIKPQSGAGGDEYSLTGTVHEISGPNDGVVHGNLGGYYELGGDNPSVKELSQGLTFHLDHPATSRWPKVFVVLLHLIEVDEGGDYRDMINDLWDLAVSILPDLYEDIEEALREAGIDKWGAAGGASLLIGIGALIAANIEVAILGMVLALVAYVVANVIIATEDDFFGTASHVLALPTNTLSYVETLAGHPVGRTVTDNQFAPYGSFVTDQVSLRIYGGTVYPSAAAYDGIVDLKLHWRFRGMQAVSIPSE